jgi:uncharacterized cofD-like protein
MTSGPKKVVVIGGGTGTSLLLRGLKKYPVSLSAVVTTADSGGSSGVLRRETGMAPPGDVRQCFVALNEGAHPFISLFNERFQEGGLVGHSFGNLFFALLWQKYKNFPRAVKEAEKMVGAIHHVLPVTQEPTDLVAHLKDGTVISSETNITNFKDLQKKLDFLELGPAGIKINHDVRRAVASADTIVIGPGNLLSSLTPPLLVPGVVEAIRSSRASKVLIVNLMNRPNSTKGFEVEDYLAYFDTIFGASIFDVVLYNTTTISPDRIKALGIKDDQVFATSFRGGVEYIGAPLVSAANGTRDNSGVTRSLIKHDEVKTAKVLYERIIGA